MVGGSKNSRIARPVGRVQCDSEVDEVVGTEKIARHSLIFDAH
jgi:hypothetical protein